MDSVPDAAVCNRIGEVATRKGFYNLKGFVNGVREALPEKKTRH